MITVEKKEYLIAALESAIRNEARLFRTVAEGPAQSCRDVEFNFDVEHSKVILECMLMGVKELPCQK